MKTPKEYLQPYRDSGATDISLATVELLVANVLLDAGSYKDKIITSIFRLRNGESESAEKAVAAASVPVRSTVASPAPVREAVERVLPAAQAADADSGMGEVDADAPVAKKGRVKKSEPLAADADDATEPVPTEDRVPVKPFKETRSGKLAAAEAKGKGGRPKKVAEPDLFAQDAIADVPSTDEDTATNSAPAAKGARKSKPTGAPTDEPAAAPLGKAGLPKPTPPAELGRTPAKVGGKVPHRPKAPQRAAKR